MAAPLLQVVATTCGSACGPACWIWQFLCRISFPSQPWKYLCRQLESNQHSPGECVTHHTMVQLKTSPHFGFWWVFKTFLTKAHHRMNDLQSRCVCCSRLHKFRFISALQYELVFSHSLTWTFHRFLWQLWFNIFLTCLIQMETLSAIQTTCCVPFG